MEECCSMEFRENHPHLLFIALGSPPPNALRTQRIVRGTLTITCKSLCRKLMDSCGSAMIWTHNYGWRPKHECTVPLLTLTTDDNTIKLQV